MKYITLISAILLLNFAGCNTSKQSANLGNELIVCGWDEVYILDMNNQQEGGIRKIWSWKASDQEDLPESYKLLFKSTDECKPFDQGNKILITASDGAVAFVDRMQNLVLFYARAANAHSADLLPHNRLAVAASHSRNGNGDRLIIFDINSPENELWSEKLPWGHGVVWDENRQLLYALSGDDIRIFQLKDWLTEQPALKKMNIIELPEGGGHDLYPVPGTNYLSVSTGNQCWLFDRDTHKFRPHPDIPEKAHIKSISYNPETGQVVFVQAEGENWWAERLHFLHPEGIHFVPGEHFYKARWNVEIE